MSFRICGDFHLPAAFFKIVAAITFALQTGLCRVSDTDKQAA
jgi:hypothetical protein